MNTTQQSRHERTVALIAEIVEIERCEVKEGSRLREDLGLDSLQSLELLSVLSEEMRLDLPMEEAMELATVQDACAFIERAFQEQRAGEAKPAALADGGRA